MSVGYLPSPSRGDWHLGPIPVRAYALCIVLGVIVAVWMADRRYRSAGGRAGVIIDVATWAVPAGLVGARVYSVLTDYEVYLGGRRGWVNVVKVWGRGLGIPGAVAFYLATFAVGMFAVQSVRIDYSHHVLGLRVNEWAAIIGFAAAVGYLYRTRRARSRIPVPALAAAPAADPGADPGAGSRAQLRT